MPSPSQTAGFALVLALFAMPAAAAPPDAAESDPFASLRETMVTETIVARDVTDEATLRAMRTVPRHRFVPANLRAMAYADQPLPIGHGQTISQPYIVAAMTEHLQPRAGHRVLEIGTGSGYQAAVLAEIVAEVYTIEIVPALEAQSRALIIDEMKVTHVSIRQGDGYHGWPEAAPFDSIIVTAAAETIPPPLLAQLKDGGRMIIPVGPALGNQHLILVTKKDGRVRTRTLMPVRFVPFTRAR